MTDLQPGDVVVDRVPADEESPMVVLAVHETRADSFIITSLGKTVAAAAYPEWPNPTIEFYDADADDVAEVAFVRALDYVFGDRWRRWDVDRLRPRVRESPDLVVYTYHARRLAPIDYTVSL